MSLASFITAPLLPSHTHLGRTASPHRLCRRASADRRGAQVHGARISACKTATPTSPETPSSQKRDDQSTPPTKPHAFQFVSWPQVEALASTVVKKASAERFDLILAITRGGLVPAALICEELELRTVLSATVMFYTDSGEQFFGMTEPRFLSFPSADALQGRRVLIVDDVWDSGSTANAVHARVLRAKPAMVKVGVLHYKPEGSLSKSASRPDFYGEIANDWLVYPWEQASPVVQSIESQPSSVDIQR